MADDPNIHVVTTTLKGGRGPGEWDRELVEKPLVANKLKDNFTGFVKYLEALFADPALSGGLLGEHFLLDEVTFVAELTPDGEFRLRGDCGGGQGGIRVVVRRRRTNADADNVLITTEPGKNEVHATIDANNIRPQPLHHVIDENNLRPTPLVVSS